MTAFWGNVCHVLNALTLNELNMYVFSSLADSLLNEAEV